MTQAHSKPLSSLGIKKMRVGKTLSDLGEYRGLRVTRNTAGIRYIYRFRHPDTDKLTQITLGHEPGMSLAAARLAMLEQKQMRKAGRVPSVKAEVDEGKADYSVESLADDYLKELTGRRKEKGVKDVRRTLNNVLVKNHGKLQARLLDKALLQKVTFAQIDRGNNVQAGRFLRELSAALEVAIDDGKLPSDFGNPAQSVMATLKRRKIRTTAQAGKRWLKDPELRKLFEWLQSAACTFSNSQRIAIELTLRTACRSGEAISARWEDIDLERGEWSLTDTKTGVPRTIALSKQTVAWIRTLTVLRSGEFLCPSSKGSHHLSQKSLTHQLWHARKTNRHPAIDSWSPHDLRRTVRTRLAEMGIPTQVGEAMLGHSRSGVEGIYDLAEYLPQIREWLQVWNDHLDTLRPKANHLQVVAS
jgi:integrase